MPQILRGDRVQGRFPPVILFDRNMVILIDQTITNYQSLVFRATLHRLVICGARAERRPHAGIDFIGVEMHRAVCQCPHHASWMLTTRG